MIDLCYKYDNFYFWLYKLVDGNKFFLERFEDREDLLIYIEEEFDCANLIFMR